MAHKDVGNNSLNSYQTIVSFNSNADSFGASEFSDEFDVSFTKQNTWLDSPPVSLSELALRSLAGRISRNPKDLYSLVKRIYLLKALNDSDKLNGAVYDLLRCLRARGKSLRNRVMRSVSNALNKHDFDELSRFDANPDYAVNEVVLRHSLLNQGLWGTTEIVQKRTGAKPVANYTSPIHEARELIDLGEISAAIRILTACLHNTPNDNEISGELFIIYRHMRNADAIAQLRKFLDEKNFTYPSTWIETENQLRRAAEGQ